MRTARMSDSLQALRDEALRLTDLVDRLERGWHLTVTELCAVGDRLGRVNNRLTGVQAGLVGLLARRGVG